LDSSDTRQKLIYGLKLGKPRGIYEIQPVRTWGRERPHWVAGKDEEARPEIERTPRLAIGAADNAGFLTNLESSWGLRSYFEAVMALLPAVQREIETHSQALRIRR
jgi:hypothetical protein